MVVHHRFFTCSVLDAQHADTLVLEFNLYAEKEVKVTARSGLTFLGTFVTLKHIGRTASVEFIVG